MKLGFVGLGNMGGPMVLNLLKDGHQVAVYDLSTSAMERAIAAGATAAESAEAVAEAGEMVMTSLPTPDAVESVYLGAKGLLAGARERQIFLDLSSIGPSLAKKLAQRFAERGARMLDAPVSGGTTGAKAATLSIMVGGDPEAFQQAEPVLHALGENIFHVGKVGTSSTIKILNQLMVGIHSTAVLEMVQLARHADMDMELVREIISASSGFSRIFQTEFPKLVEHDFSPGFAVDLMAKDLRLGQTLARDLGLELPVAALALSIFEQAGKRGLGQLDISAAAEVYEAKSQGL